MRGKLISFCIIVVLLVSLAAFAWVDNSLYRGISYEPTTTQPIAHAQGPQLGVNAYNIQFEPDPAVVTRTLAMAKSMGAHYIRMQMPWEDVEIHAKGDFEDRRNPGALRSAWEKYDFLFAEMQRLGLEPIVRIDRPPRWARAQADATEAFQRGLAEIGSSTGPPDQYQDYAEFVATVASRYRGTLRYIQIWNEPNLSYEWNWVLPEPERFTEMLRLAATAARTANPEVVILFPSLSPTDGLEPRIAPLSELEYLDRVYRAGGAAYFDIMSAQAYGLGQPPDEHRYVRPRPLWHRPIDTRIDVSRVVLVREVMQLHGDFQKAIWISEFGYVTAPPDLPHSWGESVSETQRAEYLVGQLERAQREWPWIGVMNVWMLRWGGPDPDPRDPTAYFAIVGRDFTPTPAYLALQEYTARPPAAAPGVYSWNHPAISQLDSSTWQIRFSGQTLDLIDVPGPFRFAVGPAPLAAYTPAMERQVRQMLSNLADTTHVATYQSTTGAPKAIRVGRIPPAPWLWNLLPLLIMFGLAIALVRLIR
jgi:polysaccharide biosynthesis protein PslG